MDHTTLFLVVLVGGLLGLFAQGLRAASGLSRLRDTASRMSLRFRDLFVPSRLIVNLLIGFVIGIVATFIVGVEKLIPFDRSSWIGLAGIVVSSYSVTDIIDHLLRALNIWKPKKAQASPPSGEELPSHPASDELLKLILSQLSTGTPTSTWSARQIGSSTDPSSAENRDNVAGSEVASLRYNNPGAQYPSASAARFGQIGRSTDPSTAENRDDVVGSEVASFRYNNPGAQYPSARAARFGQTGYGIIGGGHKIARFPSPVNGAASNFDLLSRSYVGMRIGEAGTKWTGAHGFGVPGYDANAILTKEMVDDAVQAVALLKAIAGRESGKGNNLTEEQWRQAHRMYKAGSADAFFDGLPAVAVAQPPASGVPSGAGLVQRARAHIGEQYVNTQVPKDDPHWHGPWDCAEFVSWLVYQEAGTLYGCVDHTAQPAKADAYTGAWKADLERLGKRVSVEEAAATVGGIVLRYPPGPGKMGHIAVCDGNGGTIEAKGRRYGVVADTVHGRGWHTGILIPGISYDNAAPIKVSSPAVIYEVGAPNMDMAVVARIQAALAAKGFDPGLIDGEFGLNTQAAVLRFQEAEGMVVDGAVGPETAAALGVSLGVETVKPGVTVAETGPAAGAAALDLQQRLPLLLMLLSKEKPMAADPAKPGQGLELLLPLILQSALTGKQLDIMQLLTVLATGKPAPAVTPIANAPALAQPVNTVPAPVVSQPATQPGAAAPVDPITVLMPLLYERLTGKPLPGTEKPDKPAEPLAPAMSRLRGKLFPGTDKPDKPTEPLAPALTSSFLYATNRRASSDEAYFSGERADEITYGTASVQIPEAHKIGKVELPFKLSVLSFTFYEERLDPQKHFTIKSVDVRPVEDWMKLISSSSKSSALVFVHGFNTTFRDALYRAGQIFWDLQYQGIPVLFSWPSRGAVLDYVYDRDSAYGARDSFVEVLRKLRSAGAIRVDILAHSMGNLVVLEALANHQHANDPLGIAEILMAAPDVDKDNYRKIVAKVRAAVPGMTLYASSADRALAASKRIAGNIARAGDVSESGPLLVDGIDSIDVTAIGEELFGLGHSPYATTVSLLNDISILITQGTRPPNARQPVEISGMPMGQLPPSWWRLKPR